MGIWSPASAEDVTSIIERDLLACPHDLVELFQAVRVPLRTVPIVRFGNIESVFVVAEKDGVVIYYEDVEEGFNISPLAADGSIATPRWEQWKLYHALWHFEA